MIADGTPLVDDPARIGAVTTLGWTRSRSCGSAGVVGGCGRPRSWTSPKAGRGGRDAAPACAWLAARDPVWRAWIRFGTLDLSGSYREAANNLIKKVKRIAHGMTHFVNWRIRVLLAAGRPDWNQLPYVTPAAP